MKETRKEKSLSQSILDRCAVLRKIWKILSGISCAKFAHQTRSMSSMFYIRPTSTMSYHTQSLAGRSSCVVWLRCEGGDQLQRRGLRSISPPAVRDLKGTILCLPWRGYYFFLSLVFFFFSTKRLRHMSKFNSW